MSGDVEGSPGGLARQGQSGKIENIILNVRRNAMCCTLDPVCNQFPSQGLELLNWAACHYCALLLENML